MQKSPQRAASDSSGINFLVDGFDAVDLWVDWYSCDAAGTIPEDTVFPSGSVIELCPLGSWRPRVPEARRHRSASGSL
jgi:hypothetical protein